MSRILFRSAALVSLLFLSVAAEAQRSTRNTSLSVQVTGQVRYAQGGRPAEIVLVRLESFGGGIAGETTTDRTGNFRFSGMMADLYMVTVRAAGFREAQQQVDLRAQLTDYVQLQLVAEDTGSSSSLPTVRGAVIDANVPERARAEFEKGRAALLEAHNTHEGILHLENAVRLYPKYLEAMLLIGTAYMDQGEWDKAELALRKTIEIEPKAANAYFALGDLYRRQKEYERAEKVMQDWLAIESHSASAHLTLARVYWDKAGGVKDEIQCKPPLERSYEEVKRALALNANLAAAHLLKGNLLFKARRGEEALKEFEEYLRLDPNGEFSEQAKETVQKIKQALARR